MIKPQYEILSSIQNPKIKFVSELLNSKGRKKHGLFIAEGLREMQIAFKSGYTPIQIFFNNEFLAKKDLHSLSFFNLPHYNIFEVDKKLFSKIAYREDTEGIFGLFKIKHLKLDDLKLSDKPLFIVLESVEKPGNLGAILRTADAANVDGVIVCDPIIDLFNPNVVRSSIGCLFSVPVVLCSTTDAINWLKENKITIFAAALQNADLYHLNDYKEATALVFGTEADGLSKEWIIKADKIIKIPMLGRIDSLNVSNAVAIMTFEAVRQRSL